MSNTQQNHGCRLTISSDTKCNARGFSFFEKPTSILTLSTAEKSKARNPKCYGFKKEKEVEEDRKDRE